MSPRPGALLLLVSLLACGRGDAPPAADAGAAGDPAADSIPLDTAAVAGGGVPGELLAAAQQGAPEDVVRLLLQWDTAGLRFEGPYADALSRLYCFLPEQQCLSEEPAWDYAVVVEGYQLDRTFESADSAQLVVLFDELGTLWPEATEGPPGSPPVTFSLKRLDGNWRIVGIEPGLPPHLSPGGVARRYRGLQPDSVVIGRWLRDLQEE